MKSAMNEASFLKNSDVPGPAQELSHALFAEITSSDKLGIWIMLDGIAVFCGA